MHLSITRRCLGLGLAVALLHAALAMADDAADKKEDGEEKSDAAVAARLAEEKEMKARFGYSFNDVQNHLVLIECEGIKGRSAGSGFVAFMDGKPYLFTNQHIIMGAEQISFKTASGHAVQPLGVELSARRDIARLPLPLDYDALAVSGELAVDDPIAVFGNSEGGGVATELYGKVNGVGSDRIEVSADFVPGNSGSPVLNLDKQVIGIASYIRWKSDDKKGEEIRRFCYRLDDVEWRPVNWKKYNDAYGKPYRETEMLIDAIFEIIGTWYSDPSSRIPASSCPAGELRYWSDEHNQMVNKIEKMLDKGSCTQVELDRINRKIRTDLIDSAETLSGICETRARTVRMFSSKQRDLTGFLDSEFESLAIRLEAVSMVVKQYGKKLEHYNYFRFK